MTPLLVMPPLFSVAFEAGNENLDSRGAFAAESCPSVDDDLSVVSDDAAFLEGDQGAFIAENDPLAVSSNVSSLEGDQGDFMPAGNLPEFSPEELLLGNQGVFLGNVVFGAANFAGDQDPSGLLETGKEGLSFIGDQGAFAPLTAGLGGAMLASGAGSASLSSTLLVSGLVSLLVSAGGSCSVLFAFSAEASPGWKRVGADSFLLNDAEGFFTTGGLVVGGFAVRVHGFAPLIIPLELVSPHG